MTEKINWIDAIPQDAREEIIHDLSKNDTSELVPLQINTIIYWIPLEVNMLIKALEVGEIDELEEERILN
jgi:hypothetical protein|tara:strand:- start:404 stop:613 length:210 start_codon:yes stop_codon:yes gene_type:complete